MITNHGYLDNPTFRGMRQSLMHTFDEIYVLDLHGNTKKKESCPDGGKDENVFDIQQGTAIVLMVKGIGIKNKLVCHHELFGLRQLKYEWLESNTFHAVTYQALSPNSPFYLFRPEAMGNEHYLQWTSLTDIFPVNSVGIVTARDGLTIQDSKDKVRKTIHHFASLDPETARITYQLGNDTQDWKVHLAQKDLIDSGMDEKSYRPILYRPYDVRYTFYTGLNNGFHCRPRNDVMKHLFQSNIALVCSKRVEGDHAWNHVFLTDCIATNHSVSIKEANYSTPLYLYPDDHKEDIFSSTEREYNIAPELINRFKGLWPQFQPEQLFYYVYAILHSNIYRERYAQYLRMDFPRIPFTEDFELFGRLAVLGNELADLHLLKSPRLDPPLARYQGSGSNDRIEQIKYDPETGRVTINADKHFEGVTPELWDYHIGGYQVMHKYLKDRKGKSLSDPIHYCRMVTALAQTIRIQKEIDRVFEDIESRLVNMESQ